MTSAQEAATEQVEDEGKRILVDINAKVYCGYTLLHSAAEDGHQHLAQLLVEANADVNAKTATGHTALALAQARRHDQVVRVLTAGASS